MAQPFCTGPCAVYAGVLGPPPLDPLVVGLPRFVGHSEVGVEIDEQPEFDQLMCDVGGTKIPFDEIYQGEHHFIFGNFTVFNWPVWTIMNTRPNFAANKGRNALGDIGTLMITEGFAFNVWLQFPYVLKPAMANPGMPAGRRYVACRTMGGKIVTGTRANTVPLMLHALRAYDKTSGAMTLYDENLAALPASGVPPAGILGV